MAERMEHGIGRIVYGDQIDKAEKVLRLHSPERTRFKVTHGSSCTQCSLAGLGHVICPEIACSMHDRSDGQSVVYQELTDDERS